MIINFYVDEIVVNNGYVCNLGFAQKLNFSLIIFRRNYVSQVIWTLEFWGDSERSSGQRIFVKFVQWSTNTGVVMHLRSQVSFKSTYTILACLKIWSKYHKLQDHTWPACSKCWTLTSWEAVERTSLSQLDFSVVPSNQPPMPFLPRT